MKWPGLESAPPSRRPWFSDASSGLPPLGRAELLPLLKEFKCLKVLLTSDGKIGR